MRLAIYESANYKWIVFATVALGSITNVTHHGGVSIALPTIAQSLSVSLTTVQWVILAESLAISAMLLPMGKLSDLVGRKPIHLIGLCLFGTMAFFSGISPWLSDSIGSFDPIICMIFFRVLQGIGAAMTQATGMAMVTSVFENNERGKGLGAHGSVIGTGGIIGPILGGLLVTYAGWEWVFWINVPLCAIALAGAIIFLDPSRFSVKDEKNGSFDWVGAGLSTSIIMVFLFTLSNGSNVGWLSIPILVGALLFILSVIGFIWWESKSNEPMLDLKLFRQQHFTVGIVSNYLSFLGVTSFRFIIPFFLQAVFKLSPAQVAYVLIPNAISRIILGPLTGYLSDRYGIKPFTTFGLALCGAGLYMMGLMVPTSSLTYTLSAIIVFSCGSGIFMSPNSAGIFISSANNRHGVVSALVNLSRNSGNITGIVIATAIIAQTMLSGGYSSDVDQVLSADPQSELISLFISGMRIVFFTMGTLQILSTFAHAVTPSIKLEQ